MRVRTMERAEEILAECTANGWQVIAGVEVDEPEDLRDLERLRATGRAPAIATPKGGPGVSVTAAGGTGGWFTVSPGPRDPCSCRSGRRYGRCCGR